MNMSSLYKKYIDDTSAMLGFTVNGYKYIFLCTIQHNQVSTVFVL